MSGLFMRPLMAAALAAAAIPGHAHAAGLSVCIDQSSPSAAMDRKLAGAVANQEGLSLAVHPFDGGGDDEGFALKNFRAMAANTCDLVLGFPIDATNGAPPSGLQATDPYAHISFVLVTAPGVRGRTLADLPNGTDVGVTYLTTPNLYLEAHPNVSGDIFDTEGETMQGLASHQVRAAMLWRPTIVQYLIQHPNAVHYRFYELQDPHERFNIVALYGARGSAMAARFEDGVARLSAAGLLGPLVMPYAAPGALADKKAALSPARPLLVLTTSDAAGHAAPALYTQAQADAGSQKFAANCAICHGKDLTGMAGPALKGKNFASVKADFHVSDVFKILTENMPATQPGSLPKQDYVEIMAFLLEQNGYPAGATPLTFAKAHGSQVKLVYRGD